MWFILILFLGLNGWLLYSNANYKHQTKWLKWELVNNNHSNYDTPYILTFDCKNIDFSSPFKLIAFFSERGCTSCIDKEIQYLNKWVQSYDNDLQVFFTGINAEFLRLRGAKFEYKLLKNPEYLFNVNIKINNPVVLVVDENNMVHHIHKNNLSMPFNDQK